MKWRGNLVIWGVLPICLSCHGGQRASSTSRETRPAPINVVSESNRPPLSCQNMKVYCPAGTYPDASNVEKENFSAEVIGGAPVTTTTLGSCRWTCRQVCPDDTVPTATETVDKGRGFTLRRYTCDANPRVQYVAKQSPGNVTGHVLRPVRCATSEDAFARDFCSVKKCDPGWSRGSVRVEISGEVYAQTGLESDHILRGQCGTVDWKIRDSAGLLIEEGQTKKDCINGKGLGGKAVIKVSGEYVVGQLTPDQMERIATVAVIANCD